MSKKNDNKRKQQVAQIKQKKRALAQKAQRDGKISFLYNEAGWYYDQHEHEKALTLINRLLKLNPAHVDALQMMGQIGKDSGDNALELKALRKLRQIGRIDDRHRIAFCFMLLAEGLYEEALSVIEETLPLLPAMPYRVPKTTERKLAKGLAYARQEIEDQKKYETFLALTEKLSTPAPRSTDPGAAPSVKVATATPPPRNVQIEMEMDDAAFDQVLAGARFDRPELLDLVLTAYGIRFTDTFDQLLCLPRLRQVRSLWYQEETARKILKSFRGRALLADEVGLGKTIEAGMVLTEYLMRRMVQTVLILTPTPLVSQWRTELSDKFDLTFATTDDPDFRTKGSEFWQAPRILASINMAKSRKHQEFVIAQEWDLLIVDEAHHLKNRTTQNWKLVNQLKKRFLLLLTATPVENNLLELYNLITLLKPGQLGTVTDFKKEFITRGDPTDPQNRTRLRELLHQVMIRNTRAVARIEIPARFAETIRIAPSANEAQLYERITRLAASAGNVEGAGHQMLFKTLLEEAGSSPDAVRQTLLRLDQDHALNRFYNDDLTALKTLCRTMTDTGKNQALLKIIKGQPGKKLIFVKYRASVTHLSDFLDWQRIGYVTFHGGMTNPERDAAVERFQHDAGVPVLIATEIGGEGRNLQFCNLMINYDLPWNPMKIEQRIGRLHRLGQTKEVRIFNLCAAGSLEDYILDILDRKINMFEMVIGEIDMILGRALKEADFGEQAYGLYISSQSAAERQAAFDHLGSQIKRAKTGYVKTRDLDDKLFGEDYEL